MADKSISQFEKMMESYAGLEGISEFEKMIDSFVTSPVPKIPLELESEIKISEPEPIQEELPDELVAEVPEDIPYEEPVKEDPIKLIADRIGQEQQSARVKKENVEIDYDKRLSLVEQNLSAISRRSRDFSSAMGGSGEVRLLKLDDVDTSNLANDRYLKYNSTTSKFAFTTGTAGGSKHTVQKNDLEDGSDSTTTYGAKTNMLFDDNTFRVINDSGTDSTNIRLNTEFTGITNGTALANKVLILGASRAIDNVGAMTAVTSYEGGAVTSSGLVTGNKINATSTGTESIKTAGGITMAGAIAGATTITGTKVVSSGTGAASVNTSGGVTMSGAITGATTINCVDIDVQDTNSEAIIQLHRNETGSNGNAVGKIKFKGTNSASEEINFAQVGGKQKTITDGSEDGEIELNVMNAGTMQTSVTIDEDGMDIPGSRTIKFGGADAFRIMTTQASSSVATNSGASDGRIKVEIAGNEYYIPIWDA